MTRQVHTLWSTHSHNDEHTPFRHRPGVGMSCTTQTYLDIEQLLVLHDLPNVQRLQGIAHCAAPHIPEHRNKGHSSES